MFPIKYIHIIRIDEFEFEELKLQTIYNHSIKYLILKRIKLTVRLVIENQEDSTHILEFKDDDIKPISHFFNEENLGNVYQFSLSKQSDTPYSLIDTIKSFLLDIKSHASIYNEFRD